MTVRVKLNLAVAALILVFLVSAGFALIAVTRNATNSHVYSQMRELGRLTSDIRTDIYHQIAYANGGISPRNEPTAIGWPEYVLEDIEVQLRLATSDLERESWEGLREAITDLHEKLIAGNSDPHDEIRNAERHLRELRSRYDLAEFEAIAASASTSYLAQIAIALAGLLTVVLFLVYLLMVRDWLVRPIGILMESADTIGHGQLDHRVPLGGNDELAALARRIDMMAERLAAHQKALIEARELSAIGELCTNVAHGLRNPLASLRASAQLAGRRAGDPEETKVAMLEIVRQVDRLDDRITRLFEFSRPERRQMQCTTFEELADTATLEVSSLTRKQGVELRMVDETDHAVWYIDGELMTCVLAELMTNALHHSEPGTWLRVAGSIRKNGDDERLEIRVIDCGKGMPKATVRKAFDLFFTGRPNGTGMGLAMARRAVDRLDGTITIESEPDRGTTVTVVVGHRCRHFQHGRDRDGAMRFLCRDCDGPFVEPARGEKRRMQT